MRDSLKIYQLQPSVSTTKVAPQRDSFRYGLRLINRFLAGQRRLFVLALVMLIAEAVTAIFEAYPLAYLIDYLRADRPDLVSFLGLPILVSPLITTIAALTTAIILMAMINSLADSLAEIYLAKGGRMLGYNLRTELYSHLQQLSLAFHDQRRTGDTLTRVTGDVSALEDFIIGSLSDIVGSVLVLIGTLVFLTYNSWEVALVAAVIVPVMAVVSNYFAQRIKTAAKQQRAREGDLASATQEMLTSIRVIQTYRHGDHELQRFGEYNQKNVAAALLAAGLQARFSWVVKVLEALAISVVVWLGLWLINSSTITVGMLLMFIVLIQNMFKPTRKIIKEWNTIGKIFASVERIGELLDRKPAVSDAPNAVQAAPFQGRVEFRQVSFAYQPDLEEEEEETMRPGARTALQDVSFSVAPGEVLALVGHTGAGKSTIVQLLPRLYDPSSGQIWIDGHDIRTLTLESLRTQIGVVLQETILFNGSVADNIAYGRTDATSAEIVAAATQANAHEFIEKLPEGYNTLLGERGANLSGGQRQRIAIARAFIRNPPLLILDEPTTGLDAESAMQVLLALRTLMSGKTTIIISHDLKLIREANKIVVIKDGKIEQLGTHHQLLKAQGVYASLYKKQFEPLAEKVEDDGGPLGVAVSPHNLLHSLVMQQKLPTVATAFDAEAMRAHLQNALLDPVQSNFTIVGCTPGKATYLDGEGCLLRYELEIRNDLDGQVLRPLVLARVFPDRSAATIYLRERLAPLAAQMQDRPEIAPFTTPVALIEPLNMAVNVFPIDGELPTLVSVTDCRRMIEIFRQTLSETLANQFIIENCFAEPGHYGRQHRCVLRYTLSGRWAQTGATGCQVVYGKVAADGRGELVGPVLLALRQQRQNSRSAYRFNLPYMFGYRPDLHLVLLEAIPGAPQLVQLLKARLNGTSAPGDEELTLESALVSCARIAATLHTSGITLGHPRTLDHELADLQEQLVPVRQLSPTLARQVQEALQQIKHHVAKSDPLPLCFSHGDFTHTQLLFDGAASGLVDFDTVCQAEAALDLGQFQAYLRLAVRKIEPSLSSAANDLAEDLCTQFFHTYRAAAGYDQPGLDRLHLRMRVYEIVSLLRVALHSWQKLKESRLEHVIPLVEERISCLPSYPIPALPQRTPLRWLDGSISRRPHGLPQP